MLDVKVETIDSRTGCTIVTVERTRAIPALIIRTECLVQKVGKIDALVISGHLVVASSFVVDSTDAQKNLDSALLAVWNALLDSVAFTEE